MTKDQIAMTTYNIRDYCRTEEDFTRSIGRVAEIGYAAVQIAAVGAVAPERIKTICAEHGLAICGSHEPGITVVDDPHSVVRRLEALGSRYVSYPFPHGKIGTVAEVQELAARLENSGTVFADAGFVLTYHNHNHEFVRLEDGRTPLEILYQETSPAHLAAELDTYWVQAGGASPETWIRRLAGRLPLLHLKDGAAFQDGNERPELRFTSLGRGHLEWPALLAAADEAGTEWFIVEQDGNWIGDDPFRAAEESYRYLIGMI